MKKVLPANDTSFLQRFFHIPYIIQMFRLVYSDPKAVTVFPSPRFELFTPILSEKDRIKKPADNLLSLVLQKHKKDIIIGMLLTFILTALNLLIPQIIREFFSLMKLQTLQQSHINKATFITEKFIVLQILRAFVSGHVTRCFYELSLKIQSCLSAQITGKALRINSECRTKLPQSEVYHLENVDLKTISKLFQHLSMILQIPMTLSVAVLLLFRQSISFGVVGLYWIIIVYFLQRWLSDKLAIINKKKYEMMQERSKINYEMIQKIRLARLDHSENILLQKNNDYFIKENKIQSQFYLYQSFFDISLMLLPIIVAISISLYDHNQEVSMTISEVYMLLTLLGLCYKPLKNLQQFFLRVEEGMHSFKRIRLYLNLPQNNRSKSKLIRNSNQYEPRLKINRNTMTMLRSTSQGKTITRGGFYTNTLINLQKGQRLVVLARKGQGATNFLRSLIGQIYTVSGSIKLDGMLAYLPQANFFRHESLRKNIEFYSNQNNESAIKAIYETLSLEQDLKFRKGLDEIIQKNKFSEIFLKKIGLARVLYSQRDAYILDSPFLGLGVEVGERLEKRLREQQQKGVMIIMAESFLRFAEDTDKVIILSQGQVQQYGTYSQLMENQESGIHLFHSAKNLALSDRISFLPVVREFQMKIKKILVLSVMAQQRKKKQVETQKLSKLLLAVGKYTMRIRNDGALKKQLLKKQKQSKNYFDYFKYFLSRLPLIQWAFIFIIIVVAELLHVFIQYQIGQQYKKGGASSLDSLRQLMKYQFALTCGLALLIYLQYYVLCLSSSIIGNKIYEKSLESVCQKNLKWYQKTPAPFISDKYNHDYQQIYIILKFIFDFFKFTTVMITTIFFINVSYQIIMVITTIIALYYYFMLRFFRRAQETLIRSHAIYKHDFVKIFDEIIEGGLLINIFGKNNEAYQEAKRGFISVASHKQAVNSCVIIESLLCELTSCLIIALAFEYGTIIKIKEGEQNQALIAVSVMLLVNLSEVFKNIMSTLIKLQNFFRLKMISIIEIIDSTIKLPNQNQKQLKLIRHNIQFKQVFVKQKQDAIFQIYPLTLNISQGQKVILFQEDNQLRNNLLMALTNNLQNFSLGNYSSDVLRVGNLNITAISKEILKKHLAVLMPQNFYFSATIQENLKWKNNNYNYKTAFALAQTLHLEKQIPEFEIYGLHAEIKHVPQHQRELSRKIALIKAVLKQPKVLIIKDTPWMIGKVKITQLLKQWKINCTIIGITNDITGCSGAERFIYLQKLKIIEDDSVENMINNELSIVGTLIRNCNFNSYDLLQGQSSINMINDVFIDKNEKEYIKSSKIQKRTTII